MERKFVFNNEFIHDHFNQLAFNYSIDYSKFINSNLDKSKFDIFNGFMKKIYLEPIVLNRHNVSPVGKIEYSEFQRSKVLMIYLECKSLLGNADLIQYSLPGIDFPMELQFISTESNFALVFETKEFDMKNGPHLASIYRKKYGDLIKNMFDNILVLNEEIRKFNLKNSFKLSEHLIQKSLKEINIDFRVFYPHIS